MQCGTDRHLAEGEISMKIEKFGVMLLMVIAGISGCSTYGEVTPQQKANIVQNQPQVLQRENP